MSDCRCLNKHSHPGATKGCSDGCMMCCGYTTPAVIAFMIAALVIVSDVYSIILIARNPHSAWRIIVCLIVFILTTFLGAVVCWAYYAIIFTSPGFVPHDPWMHPPTYAGPPLPPPTRDPTRGLSRFPPSSGTHPITVASAPQVGTDSAQQLTPSMARRSPNASGEHIAQQFYNPNSNAALPSSSPPPPPLPQRQGEPHTTINPLQDRTPGTQNSFNAAEEQTEDEARKAATVQVGTALYSESGESGNGHHRRPAPLHSANSNSSHAEGEEGNTRDNAEMRKFPVHCGVNGENDEVASGLAEDGSPAVPVGAGRPSNSPFATPNYPSSTTQQMRAPTAPQQQQPLNPYRVTTIGPNNTLRYCHHCRLYKPDNAHHCRVCGRCVFNFDHHCPFVNNCVGRNNYKLFVIFLMYSGIGATLAGGLMAVTIFAVDTSEIMFKIGWIAVPAVDVVLGLSLLLFYCQHQVLLCRGETTLDSIARGDDTFAGWKQSISRPRKTAEEKAALKQQKEARVARHYRTLFGNESPWWRRYVPLAVRTDDRADDTVPGNV